MADWQSLVITQGSRAGRAPYNFVPCADVTREDAEAPPAADRFHDDRLTGYLDLHITALTQFYIRGAQPLADNLEGAAFAEPFIIDGRLRLPGSSLRGMLRTLVEILSEAPLEPINDHRFTFRTLGGGNDEDAGTYEPCYKKQSEYWSNVRAGYLHRDADGWFLRPGKQIECESKFKDHFQTEATGFDEPPRRVRFSIPVKRGKGPFCIVDVNDHSPLEGTLVQTGKVEGKKRQWVVSQEDPTQQFRISLDIYNRHANAVRGQGQPLTSGLGEGSPCFFVASGSKVTYFGKTRYFPMPHGATTQEVNNIGQQKRKDPESIDLARAMFGWVTAETRRPSRVFVEDAIGVDSEFDSFPVETVIFSGPKPSTFQHYLVQVSENRNEAIPWSDGPDGFGNRRRLRGYKRYWHRKDRVALPQGEGDVSTQLRRVQAKGAGPHFTCRIRFENLSTIELGALLTATELRPEMAHQIGTGKPYGMGSIRLSISSLKLINFKQRYSSFDDEGTVDASVAHYQQAFATNWHKVEDIWSMPRFRELAALLNWQTIAALKPDKSANWNNMTRYLRIEPVNEYTLLAPRVHERRRPLPLAHQVLADLLSPFPVLPRDP